MNNTAPRDALPHDHDLHWYRIDRVLGQGGFGITYLAHDTNLEQTVAIKEYLPLEFAIRVNEFTVAPRTDSQEPSYRWGLERFISEARTLAKFDHRSIVRVHSVFEFNNTAYMVMRYEQGESLDAILEREKTLREDELMSLLLPILEGLREVHRAGFIHRDIKPANIYRRLDGSPVLLDFGSARQALGRSKTLTILIAPGYAPFEQYYSRGEEQGPWSDIYSLGATLYRGIAGIAPIDAIERSKGILGSTRDILVPAALVGKGRYSNRFLEAIDHALSFDEKKRPQSLDHWLRELKGETESAPSADPEPTRPHEETGAPGVVVDVPAPAESPGAPPTPPPLRHGLSSRRHRSWALGSIAGALIGVASSIAYQEYRSAGVSDLPARPVAGEVDALRADLSRLTGLANAARTELDQLEAGRAEAETRLASLEGELPTLLAQRVSVSREIETLQTTRDEKSARVSSITATLADLERRRAEEESRLNEAKTRLAAETDSLRQREQEIAELTARKQELETAVDQKSEKSTEVETQALARLQSTKQELAALEGQVLELERRRLAEESRLVETKARLDAETVSLRERQQETAELAARTRELETEVAQKSEKSKELSGKLADLDRKRKADEEKLAQARAEKQPMDAEIASQAPSAATSPGAATKTPSAEEDGELGEPGSASDDLMYLQGLALLDAGHHDAALGILEPLAKEACHPQAQIKLAEIYAGGKGMKQPNSFLAYLWYRVAQNRAGEAVRTGLDTAAKALQPAQKVQADRLAESILSRCP